MPEDVGGSPFSDGWDPDDDRGGADEEFATVVFDEDFVRAATIHEPSAVERLLAAAEASEAESRRGRSGRGRDDFHHDGWDLRRGRNAPDFDDELYDPDLPDDGYGYLRPYGRRTRWHRMVAWLLALVMGAGMVALAFTAVYRGASSSRQDRVPAPASTEVDNGASDPSASVAPGVGELSRQPAVSGAPATP